MNAESRNILDPLFRDEGYIPGEERKKLYHAALEMDPLAWDIYYHRGIDYFEIGEHKEALPDLTAALSLAGSAGVDAETQAEIHLFRGLCYRFLHYNGPAVAEFLKVLSCTPKSRGEIFLRAKIELGYMYYLLGKDFEAASVFDEIEALEKKKKEPFLELGRYFEQAKIYRACLYFVQGEVEKAETLVQNNPSI